MKVKGKTTLSSSKMTTKTTTVKTREKKAYSLAGQKFDVPEEVLGSLHAFSSVFFFLKWKFHSCWVPPVLYHMLMLFVNRENHWGYSMSHYRNKYRQVKWQSFGEFPCESLVIGLFLDFITLHHSQTQLSWNCCFEYGLATQHYNQLWIWNWK